MILESPGYYFPGRSWKFEVVCNTNNMRLLLVVEASAVAACSDFVYGNVTIYAILRPVTAWFLNRKQ